MRSLAAGMLAVGLRDHGVLVPNLATLRRDLAEPLLPSSQAQMVL